MRYQLELDIEVPRERVVELFLDSENLRQWQPELVSFEHIGEHEPRQVGAKSRQIHKMGRREIEIIETITVHNYPDEFSATYESDGVWNLVENRFLDAGENKTHWILDTEFKCSGFIRIIAFFMPGAFKKQTFTYMKQFKEFAENSGAQ